MKSSECIKFCKQVFIKQVLPKFVNPVVDVIIDVNSRFKEYVSLLLLLLYL